MKSVEEIKAQIENYQKIIKVKEEARAEAEKAGKAVPDDALDVMSALKGILEWVISDR